MSQQLQLSRLGLYATALMLALVFFEHAGIAIADVSSSPTVGVSKAVDPGVRGGQYYGPDGFGEQRGFPKLVASSKASHDTEAQRRLWAVSEELTSVVSPVG